MTGGAVVWVTGRPGAGKSMLAERLQQRLASARWPCAVLDSDEVRRALRAEDYSEAGRGRFYGALGALAALLARQGLVVLVPATAHRREHRAAARALATRFLEVYVATPSEVCERRDPKGLYARARADPAVGLPGLSVPYEVPDAPEVVAEGGADEAAVEQVLRCVGLERMAPSSSPKTPEDDA